MAAYLQSLMVDIRDPELWRQFSKDVLAVTEHYLEPEREHDHHA